MAILCPYHNIMPKAVSCCFIRTTLFTKLFTCLYDQVAITSPSFIALLRLVSEIAKCIVYCCFTRTTLSTTCLLLLLWCVH